MHLNGLDVQKEDEKYVRWERKRAFEIDTYINERNINLAEIHDELKAIECVHWLIDHHNNVFTKMAELWVRTLILEGVR